MTSNQIKGNEESESELEEKQLIGKEDIPRTKLKEKTKPKDKTTMIRKSIMKSTKCLEQQQA